MDWTIQMHAEAMRGLYDIPRGPVADVTDTLDALARNPLPPDAIPAEEPGLYQILVGNHIISYWIDEPQKTIHVTSIE